MKTKRAYLVDKEKFEIRDVEVSVQPKELLVKIASCGLCNWELNHWKGLLGERPLTLGHELAGTVVDIGKEVKNYRMGDKVTMLPDIDRFMGFAEYTAINIKNCMKISKELDPEYAFAEPLKCIVTVLRAASPEVGDHGLILGCGPMGLWVIQALSGHLLSSLIAIDIDDTKLELAKKYGATHIINSKTENVKERLEEITNGHLADFVVEGTGIPSIMNIALTYIRETGRGRLIMMSSHEDACKEFSFKMAMEKSVQILVAHALFSLNQYDDFRRAVSLINDCTFKIKDLVTHEFSLENIEEAFKTLENKPEGYLKGIVVP